MHEPYKALYIHIPFCKSKCHYCDFCSEATDSNNPEIDAYIEDLVLRIFKSGRAGELSDIESIYIGGGTPSYIGSRHLTSLLYAISLSKNLTDDMEITIEANPDSLDERLVKDTFAMGVNRISIGAQSFNDKVLKNIGRPHSAQDAIIAIDAAQKRFDNISIDLMCGLPGQSMQDFNESLDQAVALNIPHISIYPLTIEEGTRMDELVHDGKVVLPDEDAVANMMELAHRVLSDAGYEHYEVSNYAKPGYQSKHNKSYWQGKPYLGLGSSAVSMVQDGTKRIRMKDGKVEDELCMHQATCEDLILSMRMSTGVSITELERLDASEFSGILDKFTMLGEQGLVEIKDGNYVPTLKGLMLGNEIYETILDFF